MELKTIWKKIMGNLLKISKLMVFVSFMYTVGVLFFLRSHIVAIMILYGVALWLGLNQIDKINKRLDKLEGK